MPNTWNVLERVKHVPAVVKSDSLDGCRPVREGELFIS
jgi:hypothetical protein